MKSITAFQTADGTIFPTEIDAEKHELLISKESLIDEYLDSNLNPYNGHAHRSMARNTIVNWELWNLKK